MKRFWVYLGVIFLLSFFVSSGSVGIRPSKFEDFFEPNFSKTYEFEAISFGENLSVRIYFGGDLKKYAETDKDVLVGGGTFKVSLNLPPYLKPGPNYLYVGVIEATKKEVSEGEVATLSAINAPIRIFVPYPGKFIEASYSISDINEGENADYDLKISNLGSQKLKISAKIRIYEKESDVLVFEKKFNNTYLKTKSSLRLKGKLETKGLSAGEYRSYAEVRYGPNEIKVLNDSFFIGKENIIIKDYDHLFETGKVNLFRVVLKSEWNSKMEGVFSNVTITRDGVVVANIVTPSVDIEPWGEVELKGYFDATNLSDGRYLANIRAYFGDGLESHKLVAIYLNSPPKEKTYFKEIVFGTAAVFFILILWLVYLAVKVFKLKRELKLKNEKDSGERKINKKSK